MGDFSHGNIKWDTIQSRGLQYQYSRTPLIRPPSESHWCGRIRGMVVREGLDYFPGCTCLTCAPRNTPIGPAYITVSYTLKMSFGCTGSRCIPRKTQHQPTTMFAGTSALSPFNTERRRPTLAAFPKNRIQKTSFKY